MDYDSAAKHLDEISGAVGAGVMPPWHAEGPHGVFANDRRLSDVEKDIIRNWISACAKPGSPSDLPPKPDYKVGGQIGQPDAVVEMPAEFHVPATGNVEYQPF